MAHIIGVMRKLDTSYTMPDQIKRDIHDHEIMLSFNSDVGAVIFHEWWVTEGEAAYQAYAEKHAENFLHY